MPDSGLPPSRFAAGYTVGAAPSTPTAPVTRAPTAAHPTTVAAAASPNAPISSIALTSFVLVLLMGPFIAPVTIPLSLIARRRITQTGTAGAGLAKAALAMSCIYLAAAAVAVILILIVTPFTSR